MTVIATCVCSLGMLQHDCLGQFCYVMDSLKLMDTWSELLCGTSMQ